MLTKRGEGVQAVFSETDHAIKAGWATYHRPKRKHLQLPAFQLFNVRCYLHGHLYPDYRPDPPDGHSPSNYSRCNRCGAWVHWYVEGQHRWGGIAKL